MKGKPFLITLFVVLCFTACDNVFDTPATQKPGYGRVVVNITGITVNSAVVNGTTARTIFPAMLFEKYEYKFAKITYGIPGESKPQSPDEDGYFSLELGDWQVTVSAFAKADDTLPAATGVSDTFTVTNDSIATVSVQFAGKTDDGSEGTFSYYIEYPADAEVTVFLLENLLDGEADDINLIIPPPSPISGTAAETGLPVFILSGTREGVPAGCYFFTIQLKIETDGTVAGANEVIYIYDKLDSAYGTADDPVVFIEDDFSFPILTGTVSIAGIAKEGETLTADTDLLDGSGTISYQWKRISTDVETTTDIGEDSDTYTVEAADAGYYITVTVTRSGNWSSVTSEPTAAVIPLFESVTGLANKLAWLQANAQSDTDYLLEIDDDESIGPQDLYYDERDNITVTLTGSGDVRTVSLSGNGSLFTVASGVTLILGDNVTLQGRNSNNASLVEINGTLIMNEGAKITGNTASSYYSGGGVYVDSNGTFTMNGGEISGNNASPLGGGVYVSGTFTMNDGDISGNNGRGVFVGRAYDYNSETYMNGTFTMYGGKISDNSGGGVYVSDGTFTMIDGEISGNTAESGGGVFVYGGGIFTMHGGKISGNTASSDSSGGGVSGTFRIVTGTIYGSDEGDTSLRNIADRGRGAALAGTVQYGTFDGDTWNSNGSLSTTNNTIKVVDGVSFIGDIPADNYIFNTATTDEWDHALNVITTYSSNNNINFTINVTADFYVTGRTYSNYTFGSASGVTVTLQGTGMTLTLSGNGNILRIGTDQTVVMNDLTLRGHSSNNDSLVYVSGGTFTMNDGEISGNTSSDRPGGGVYNSGTFTMNGGKISGNSASYGGGVYVDSPYDYNSETYVSYGTFTMYDGEISGNTAENGGGVYVSHGTFRIVTGTIYGSNEGDTILKNTATDSGAALAGTVQYGTFDGDTWNSNGSLSEINDTIKVEEGDLVVSE